MMSTVCQLIITVILLSLKQQGLFILPNVYNCNFVVDVMHKGNLNYFQ